VLIGPIRDAADSSAMQEALRKNGFREIIRQRY
jgi:cell division protein FtsN